MEQIYVVMIVVCLLVLTGMTFHVQTSSIFDSTSKRRFALAFAGIGIAAAAEMLGYFIDGCLLPPAFHTVITLTEFCLTPTLSVLLSIACGIRKHAFPVGLIMLVHGIIEIISAPFGKIFYIDASGLYHRGEWYNIYIVAYILSFGYLFWTFFLLSKRFQNRDISTLFWGGMAVLAGLIPSIVDGSIKTAFLGLTLLSLVFYIYYEGLTQQDLSAELAEQYNHIRTMQEKMIIGIADVIESRDNSTGTHIKNTADYVERLSKKALEKGLYPDIIDRHFVEMVTLAAPMHDVGKIAVPDSILKKPGPLTDEEFEVMKTHAATGGQMIHQILEGVTDEDYTKIAFDVANYHHEKWDGSGYPDHLAGENIPLSARIMALADVYDALTMERVYKKAFSKEKALSIISENIGKHFDPLLGPLFVEMMRDESISENTDTLPLTETNEKTKENKKQWSHKIRIRAAVIAVIPITLLLAGFYEIFITPLWDRAETTAEPCATEWMSSLDDDILLSDIRIPGTHNSASYHISLPYFTRCQNTEIPEQLNNGFRLLDLRLRSDKGLITLCHSFAYCKKDSRLFSPKLTLDDLVCQFYDFLDKHPSETILITVKAEMSDKDVADIEAALLKYIEETPDKWLASDSIPRLGDARGKIVILRRYEDVLGLGDKAGINTNWGDQHETVPADMSLAKYNFDNIDLYVQDRYRYNIDEKKETIASSIRQAAGISEKGTIKINFCSTAGDRAISHPKNVSSIINSSLTDMDLSGNIGWLIFDYGSPDCAKLVYDQNN